MQRENNDPTVEHWAQHGYMSRLLHASYLYLKNKLFALPTVTYTFQNRAYPSKSAVAWLQVREGKPLQNKGESAVDGGQHVVFGPGGVHGFYLAEPLLGELLLLELEDEGVELLLQPLVGVVDEELLERVGAERLESEDVQQTDEPTPVDQADQDQDQEGGETVGSRTSIETT